MGAPRVWPRALIVLVLAVAAFVLIAAIGGRLYWEDYQHTPQYSLAMLAHAVANHDWESARQYVDVPAIVSAGVEEEIQRTLSAKTGPLAGTTRAIAEAAKPKLTDMAYDALREAVEEKRDWGAPAVGKLGNILAVSTIANVTITNGSARVTVAGPGKIGTIRFGMRRAGDHWRIVQVDDAIGLITRVTGVTGVGSSGRPKPRFDLNRLRAADVVKSLKSIGVPITRVVYLTRASDPEHLLGRPGQYTEKAAWAETGAGKFDLAHPAGTIEIFPSAQAVEARLHVAGTSGQQLTYGLGNALIQIDGPMTANRAAAYRRIFESLK